MRTNTEPLEPIRASRWFTTSQTGQLLGLGKRAVIDRLRAGAIRGLRTRAAGGGEGHWRVSGEEILRLLGKAATEAQKRPSRAEFDRRKLKALKELGLA